MHRLEDQIRAVASRLSTVNRERVSSQKEIKRLKSVLEEGEIAMKSLLETIAILETQVSEQEKEIKLLKRKKIKEEPISEV